MFKPEEEKVKESIPDSKTSQEAWDGLHEDSVKRKRKNKKKEQSSNAVPYIYEHQHPDKDGNLAWVRLTKKDLSYHNDPFVSNIMGMGDGMPEAYRKMATLRAVVNYIAAAQPSIKEEFERFKKRGFI